MFWQFPANNWGSAEGLTIPPGANRVTFWAWGASGGEVVNFLAGQSEAADGFALNSGPIMLAPGPAQYTIDLTGVDYDKVVSPFGWSAEATSDGSPLVFYVDDIQWLSLIHI